jgi:hypothetical protein
LYEFISTASGLSQWFCDHVEAYGNQFTFIWEGYPQKATLLANEEEEFVRFQWEDAPKDEFFEFKITVTEITGDTVLVITDFGDQNEIKDAEKLWDAQVNELRLRLGGL